MSESHKSSFGAFMSGAVVALALASYFLFGSNQAKRNRDAVESWSENMRRDVLDKVRRIKKLSKDEYYKIVDSISEKYQKIKDSGKEEVDDLRKELHDRWDEIEKEVKDGTRDRH